MAEIRIVAAIESDVPIILEMIRGLADYEKLRDQCVATEDQLRSTLFGPKPGAEVLLAWLGEGENEDGNAECVAFALFFPNYSTFLAKPGIYLEDLFVKPHARGLGAGAALLKELARIAVSRGCGRVEWMVLDWNEPSIAFYRKLGAVPMNEWTTFRLTGEALQQLAEERPAGASAIL
jgi:GNAT superfamily N-acetyltransferase